VFRDVKDPKAFDSLMVDFTSIRGSKIGELAARFDVVLGRTAFEGEDGKLQGGVGKPEGLRRR
jgi:protocatechuate 3,4-dioxygenase beta subunit